MADILPLSKRRDIWNTLWFQERVNLDFLLHIVHIRSPIMLQKNDHFGLHIERQRRSGSPSERWASHVFRRKWYDKRCFNLRVVTVWSHDNTEFTMSGILTPQTIFDMLDLLEILRWCWWDRRVVSALAMVKMCVTPEEVGKDMRFL